MVVSGTDVVRPRGQLQKNKEDPKEGSEYGACKLLDYELEMAFFFGGKGNQMGRPLTIEEVQHSLFFISILLF